MSHKVFEFLCRKTLAKNGNTHLNFEASVLGIHDD
jgi:hypothetical protein